ncbi:MAG TPA: terminase family protein [Brevundimonas sp.]
MGQKTGRPGNPKLDDETWVALLERYVRGETQAALAAEHGVSVSAVAWQARQRGYRKKDRPDAVYRWVQPPPITAAPPPDEACGFDFDPDDLEGSEARAMAVARRAAAEGRSLDFVRVTQAVRAARRLKQKPGAGDEAGPLHHPSGGPPPPEGEDLPEPVLREAQRPPEGDWTTWLFLGGRGAGKTLAGAMWLSDQAQALGPGGRLAMIGPTLHDVREVMIEGASGVLSLARWRGGDRPVFEPSRRRLVFPNQAVAHMFSAEDPDSLRGPQFSAAWADEFCAWRGAGETLALLRMGLRLPLPPPPLRGPPPPTGEDLERGAPRLCVTTTPRPTQALRALRAEPGLVETHAGTRDNAAHLAAGFVEGLERLYGGTRRAAQEIEGRVVEVDGALWTAERLAACRGVVEGACDRVVVALDPTTTAGGNACGIVAAGRCGEAAWVLADRSVAGVGPLEWARRAAALAEEVGAVAIVAEVNQGGDMVRAVLKAAGCSVPVREVRATKGKRVRAEPVAALYEQGRVRHAAGLGRLEEELMAFGGEDGSCDFDRADALVWAITDLLIDRTGTRAGPQIRSLAWEPRGGGISQPLNLGIAGRR